MGTYDTDMTPRPQLSRCIALLLLVSAGAASARPLAEAAYETTPLGRYRVDYCKDHVSGHASNLTIRFDELCGSRIRSRFSYREGAFQSMIRIPQGLTDGLVISFYLSSLEGSKDQDEIDFEFLGCEKAKVQTNYYVGGKGGHEQVHDLGFDASEGFHKYRIEYAPLRIRWLVDGRLVREQNRTKDNYPTKPVYMYASVWDASYVNGGAWAGSYNGRDAPYLTMYANTRLPRRRPRLQWT